MALEIQLIQDLVGESESLKIALRTIQLIGQFPSHVLVQGENGTGKELAVRAIHGNSLRKNYPLVVLNGAAVSRELLESEWFGHEKGAFTGAVDRKLGVFELAHRGTLFLDEIGDIPLDLQPKLLRVIEHGTFRRLGGIHDIGADVRIIAATNKDLPAAVQRGEFREDLYHRLSMTKLRMPALRERPDDIPILVRHFISLMGAEGKAAAGKPIVTGISPDALAFLCNYHWPGNVRELKNAIVRGIVFASGDTIQSGDLHLDFLDLPSVTEPSVQPPMEESLDEVLLRTERVYVAAAYKRVNGDPVELAKIVKRHPAGLSRYLTRIGLPHLKGKNGRGPRPHEPGV
jgi:DNA-binding NtrC family response regulator